MAKLNTIKSTDGEGLKALQHRLKQMEKDAVSVGIHEDSGNHKDEDGNDGGVTVAEVAVYNEYGTPKTPERSFFRITLKEKLKKYRLTLVKILRNSINQKSSMRTDMGKLGQMVQNDIQNKIVAVREPPNAESTIKAKGTSNPLIASSQMINSTKWEYLNKPVSKEKDD